MPRMSFKTIPGADEVIWLWVRPKNPIGKWKNRPKPVVPRALLFDPKPFMLIKHASTCFQVAFRHPASFLGAIILPSDEPTS